MAIVNWILVRVCEGDPQSQRRPLFTISRNNNGGRLGRAEPWQLRARGFQGSGNESRELWTENALAHCCRGVGKQLSYMLEGISSKKSKPGWQGATKERAHDPNWLLKPEKWSKRARSSLRRWAKFYNEVEVAGGRGSTSIGGSKEEENKEVWVSAVEFFTEYEGFGQPRRSTWWIKWGCGN